MTTEPLRLYHNSGWGSAIVDVQLAFYGMPVELIPAGDLFEDQAARAAMARVNPLMQLPTLVLPDGQIMTESAAITLYLADLAHSDALVPGPDAPERAAFLRWLIFLVAAIYPTFAFGDAPERFVTQDAQAYQDRVIARRAELWQVVAANAAAQGPWFLGQRFSAIDIYLACMLHWRPRQPWFATHAPRLLDIATATAARPQISAALARNFS